MIFPYTDPVEYTVGEREIPRAKEYAYDFEKGDFKTKDNKLYFVYDNEAVKIWIHKALITSRYKELIHTWGFGSEFEDKILGRSYSEGFIKAEARRYTEECIYSTLSDYVEDLKDFNVTFSDGVLTIEFVAATIYGGVNVIV